MNTDFACNIHVHLWLTELVIMCNRKIIKSLMISTKTLASMNMMNDLNCNPAQGR